MSAAPVRAAAVRPAVIALACVVLALTTAGLGMLVTFRGLAPWNGIAACLVATACMAAAAGGAYLRRHGGHSHSPR